MTTATTQKAIKVTAPGVASLVTDAPIPRLRDDYILVKTKAVALNPTDGHHIQFLSEPGVTLGCDFSGVVIEVGKDVSRFKVGDEVFGSCHGGNNDNHEDGAFAEVITAKEFAVSHKPPHLSFEEAATLGAGLATAAQILFLVFGLPFPSTDLNPSEVVKPNSRGGMLIYGGSSATGTLLIQLAKLSGFRVYTTCSPSNFDLVTSRGADHVFDYNTDNLESHLTTSMAQNGDVSISHIIDCIGTDASATFCASSALLSRTAGGFYHSVKAPLPAIFKTLRPEESVRASTAIALMLLGETFHWPGMPAFEADATQAAFSKSWIVVAEELVRAGKVTPHPVLLLDGDNGGLEAVVARGIADVAAGKVRGRKAVAVVS